MKALVILSSLTLYDPMDCSPPCSSVHGILQARTLEWVAIPFSGGIFQIQGLNLGLPHCRKILYQPSHQEKPHEVGAISKLLAQLLPHSGAQELTQCFSPLIHSQ